MKHIAVFASGAGSNAENLIRHFAARPWAGRVELVVCNRAHAGVVERAKSLGVPVAIITAAELQDADMMLELLDRYQVDTIVLAGFLMMVPPFLTKRYEGRMLNIHPSLLPAYGGKGMYGRRVHEAVIADGVEESGITIHTVTDVYDEGKIIFQARVAVTPDDTPSSLEAKIHNLERIHFPRIVEQFA